MTTTHRTVLAAAVLLAALGVSGCSKKATEQQANPFAGAPFVLVPDQDGNLLPHTADGRPIAPSDTAPEAAKGLRNLSQGTMLKLAAPCVYWVYFNGRWYQIPC
jgi:PBP1b-binding outer membrane lipoprotein LpoB